MLAVALVYFSTKYAFAIDNGKGMTPPMGWRSWNLFGSNVNQELIQSQMDGMVSKSRSIDGVPTSLLDLGYSDVGLDDAWQICGDNGDEHYTYHAATGEPIVNNTLFPDFNAMTNYAHELGLTAGWYGNNCICRDHCTSDECYSKDVEALVGYGFDSVKLDGCGEQLDLQKWSDLINATGKSILIENCHWGETLPNASWCPFNYYRSSGDIRASYEAVIANLMTTVPLAKEGLSTPGCWSYPDMLEVGCANGPGGDNDPGLSYTEARTHFGAWCIVSSPLILSHDTTNNTISDEIWDIISNKEAIAVNQAWAGESGTLFAESSDHIVITDLHFNKKIQPSFVNNLGKVHYVVVGTWQQWSKKINDKQTAVFVINNGREQDTIKIVFADVPSLNKKDANTEYHVRDVWSHADIGEYTTSMSVTLDSHDSAFFVLSY